MRATDDELSSKLERMSLGHAPRVLELCSGCGGLSLGLVAAGFELAAHIELDAEANATYALNFAPAAPELREVWSRPRDMISQSMSDLAADFGLADGPSRAFDVLAAGLPCQAFARIGRSKLRSITGDVDAFKNDPRARLYRRFLRIVEETRPLAIVLENVPDIMNFGGHNVPEEIAEELERIGYSVRYTLLNAAFYGVPQLPERLFLIAFDESLGVVPAFPQPSHAMALPRGYEGSRSVALKHVNRVRSHFASIPEGVSGLPNVVSVKDALADLPRITEHMRDSSMMAKRKVSDLFPYREDVFPSPYADMMRGWSGFATADHVSGNVVRLTERDFPIFGRMPRGGDYPVALEIAEKMFEERLCKERRRPRPGTANYYAMKKRIVPPYDAGKFPNKWWKLVPDSPARTLTAHLGKDTYSHIHYDGRQRRMISVREAARLQSFPDGFRFAGAMNASFRQVGNAVPPLLGLAVGGALMTALQAAVADWAATRRRAA